MNALVWQVMIFKLYLSTGTFQLNTRCQAITRFNEAWASHAIFSNFLLNIFDYMLIQSLRNK